LQKWQQYRFAASGTAAIVKWFYLLMSATGGLLVMRHMFVGKSFIGIFPVLHHLVAVVVESKSVFSANAAFIFPIKRLFFIW
jgi:hypothetical protein